MITITGTNSDKFLDFGFTGETPVRKNCDKIFIALYMVKKKEVTIGIRFGKTSNGEFVQIGQQYDYILVKTNAEWDAYSMATAHTDARAYLVAEAKDPATFTIT